MESDKNPFPKIELFPRIARVAHFLLDQLRHEGLSDHNSGAAPMIDKQLYDEVQVHGFLYDGEQLEFDYGADE